MKGVVISFDALVGLSALFFLLLVVNANLAGIEENPFSDVYLREFALDAAAVLEKSGVLEQTVVQNNSTRMRQFLNQLPAALCMDLRVFRSSDLNTAILIVAKDSCPSTASQTVSFNRSFVVQRNGDANFMVAKVGAWRKT